MKPVRLLLAAAGLIVISNALSLAGVAWNRSGTPDSQLRLSERELPFAWREFGPQENSNLALRLDWQQEQRRANNWRGPDWLQRDALLGLGFDELPEDGQEHYARWRLQERNALVVLEFDGPTYQRELARAAAELAEARSKQAAAERIKDLEQQLQHAREQDSRLYAVAAGLDRASLRQRYPDRQRYAIVPARISASLSQQDKRWYVRGHISELRVGDLYLPLASRDALRAEYAQPEQQRAHYQVELAFGQRLEPWVQDVQLEPRHD